VKFSKEKSVEEKNSSLIFIPLCLINLFVSLLLLLKFNFSTASKIVKSEFSISCLLTVYVINLSSLVFLLKILFAISSASVAALTPLHILVTSKANIFFATFISSPFSFDNFLISD
jgi:hypothetical protein